MKYTLAAIALASVLLVWINQPSTTSALPPGAAAQAPVAGAPQRPTMAAAGTPAQKAAPFARPDGAIEQRLAAHRPGAGPDTFDSIRGKLQPTEANVAAVLATLRSPSATADERSAASYVAMDLFYGTSDPVLRTQIARDMSAAARQPTATHQLVGNYASLLFQPDTVAVLREARERGVLADDEYLHNLANALPGAPGKEQPELIAEVAKSKPALRNLSRIYTNRDYVADMEPAAARSALAAVRTLDAPFLKEANKIGLSDVVDVEAKVRAQVELESKLTGKPPNAVLPQVLDLSGDPRTLVAMLQLPDNAKLVKSAYDRATLLKIDAILGAFAARYSGDPNLAYFVEQARANLR